MARRYAISVLVVAALIVTALAVRLRAGDGSPDGEDGTAIVQQRSFTAMVTAIGAVRPRIGAEVRVGSRLSGRVHRLRANIGDHVEKGQVIAELEAAEYDAVVAERRAEVQLTQARLAARDTSSPESLARAAADVTRSEATARFATTEYERLQRLLATSGSTVAEVEAARERLDVARSQLALARREFDLAQREVRAEHARATAALALAEVERSFTVIRAPIAGTIASVSTQEGETVAAGLSAPTFVTIVDLRRLQVHAYVDEVDIAKIHLGQQAAFAVDAYPARDFTGRVSAIYPTATIQDNVVKYVVAIDVADDSSGLLRPEMTASVRIAQGARTVLAIPARAIRRESGRNVVYVRGSDGDEARPVRTGWRDGPWVEILGGLREGERIVLDPPAGDQEKGR